MEDKIFDFEVGEFTHTKTGVKMPSAKLNSKVEKEEFFALNELAKKQGGSYSRFAKQFLFDSVESRDAFVADVKETEKHFRQAIETRRQYSETGRSVANIDDEAILSYAEIKAIADGKNIATGERDKWKQKQFRSAERIEKLNTDVNENLPDRLLEIFKDGLKVHCPHGQVEQVFDDSGKVVSKKANYYSGLNAIILAAQMQEKNLDCASFVDSRAIYAMREKGLEIDKKIISPEIPVAQDSTLIFGTFVNKDGDKILDTREVMNVTQLEGKDVPPEVTVVNPRQDFLFEKTLDQVLSKIAELKSANAKIDLVEIAKQAKQNAFAQVREQDVLKQQRISAIKEIDVEAKPKTNGEKLRRFCKKAMEAHDENYKGYVIDGVKRFLLSTPDTKLENMTNLIDAVAPAAVFNSQSYHYSDFVKSAVREDKYFAAKLAEVKKSRSNFSR